MAKPIEYSDDAGEKGGRSFQALLVLVGGGIILLAVAAVTVFVLIDSNTPPTPAPVTLSAEAQQGKTIYLNNGCNACHPSEGRKGGLSGPRLSTTKLDDATIRSYIIKGRSGMPANPNMSSDDLNKLMLYLQAIKAAAG